MRIDFLSFPGPDVITVICSDFPEEGSAGELDSGSQDRELDDSEHKKPTLSDAKCKHPRAIHVRSRSAVPNVEAEGTL